MKLKELEKYGLMIVGHMATSHIFGLGKSGLENYLQWYALLSTRLLMFFSFFLLLHLVSNQNHQAKTSKENQEGSKKKIPKEPGIKEGQPLPDNGACKHYKKSFRWLR